MSDSSLGRVEYDRSYLSWKEWNDVPFGSYSLKDSAYYSLEMKKAGICLDQDSSVLEIGFGNGSFYGWVRNFTNHYVGTEASKELLERAENSGVESYSSSQYLEKSVAGRSFDVIVIFDVLEHMDVENIIGLLCSCRDHLSPNGVILFRVPSGDSPFSGPLINGDITHRTLLGSKAIFQLATMLGLHVIQVRGQAFPVFGMGFKTAVIRSFVVSGRAVVSRLINAVYNGNERLVVDMNLVALLKR